MERKKICPICGTSNSDTYYTDETYGICEEYYSCKECTYFIYQAYSAPIYGIVEGYPKEYTDIVKELNLSVFTEAEFEKIQW